MALSERSYLEQFDRYLTNGNLTAFEKLMSRLQNQGTSVDLTKISDLEQKIAGLFIEYFPNLDMMLRVLKFANDYHLFTKTGKKSIAKLSSRDFELRMANLQSLFGPLSEGFLHFIESYFPTALSDFLTSSNFLAISTLTWIQARKPSERVDILYSVIDLSYSNYGLQTRKHGTIKQYYQEFTNRKEKYDEDYFIYKVEENINLDSNVFGIDLFSQLPFRKQHLINASLLEKVMEKYEHGEYSYEYPIVSMITHGGTGPEGKGFTYLTPYGEVIEVCSDAKQSKAYIIEYKKYLKSIFLKKLDKRIQSWDISDKLKTEIVTFFNDNIQTEMVGLTEIETLLERDILTYLESKLKSYITSDFLSFLRKSIYDILIPVRMEDQFKVRMDLIKNNKLSETEIAKMASLGDKSHYDILDQRFFFLTLLNDIISILKKRKLY